MTHGNRWSPKRLIHLRVGAVSVLLELLHEYEDMLTALRGGVFGAAVVRF